MNTQTKQNTIKAAITNVITLKSISVRKTSNLEQASELNSCSSCSACF